MEEDISIINSNTRNEKIKNFLIQNKKKIILFLSFIIFTLIGFFGYAEYKNKKKIEISNEFNKTIIQYTNNNKKDTTQKLIKIINKKDQTYAPLSLYFIIDKKLVKDQKKVNDLFDILIDKTSLESEIKNLIIYKKALYNADNIDENGLLNIINPLINSDSVWKSHALYLAAEYFYSKNEMQKSKEFFIQIINLKNVNLDIKRQAQKIINRNFSE
jgi:hypothetical protein